MNRMTAIAGLCLMLCACATTRPAPEIVLDEPVEVEALPAPEASVPVQVVEVPTPQFELGRRFYIARHRQRHLSAAAGRLLELCRAWSSATPDTRGLQLPYIP